MKPGHVPRAKRSFVEVSEPLVQAPKPPQVSPDQASEIPFVDNVILRVAGAKTVGGRV